MSVADEARKLAEVAGNQLPGEEIVFRIRPDLHGAGEKVIKGAENILRSQGVMAVTLTMESDDTIRVQA